MNRRNLLKLAAVVPAAALVGPATAKKAVAAEQEAYHVWTGEELRRCISILREGGAKDITAYMSPWTVYDLFNDFGFVDVLAKQGPSPLFTGVATDFLGVKIVELPSIPRGKVDWVY